MTAEERATILARDHSTGRNGRIYPTDGSPAGMGRGARAAGRTAPTLFALTSGLLLALPVLALRLWRGPY